jgi:hypothetical protein
LPFRSAAKNGIDGKEKRMTLWPFT